MVLGEAGVDVYLNEEERVILLGGGGVPGLFDGAVGEKYSLEGGLLLQDDRLYMYYG